MRTTKLVTELPRTHWPQDELQIPASYGSLPPISAVNAQSVRHEFYGVGVEFDDLGYGETQLKTVALDKSADFWLTSITFGAYFEGTVNNRTSVPARISITDPMTGYDLFNPYIYFPCLLTTNTFRGTGVPIRPVQPFIQPYCFLRGSTIRITIALPAKNLARQGFRFYGSLAGWKEYEYASR